MNKPEPTSEVDQQTRISRATESNSNGDPFDHEFSQSFRELPNVDENSTLSSNTNFTENYEFSNPDIHQIVTNQIIEAIEKGLENYQMPWHHTENGLPMPISVKTGKPYQGINILVLWSAKYVKNYGSHTWGTLKQWNAKGAKIRPGETATTIVYYKTIEKENQTEELEEEDDLNQGFDPDESKTVIRFPIKFPVFNADQVDGFEDVGLDKIEKVIAIENADKFVSNTNAQIYHGGKESFYNPDNDFIQIKEKSMFQSSEYTDASENYYGTLLHEMIHWTGHHSRCGRELFDKTRVKEYAIEEIVAELGSAFLFAELGIRAEPRYENADYIEYWLEILKSDKKFIFQASGYASNAVNFLGSLGDNRKLFVHDTYATAPITNEKTSLEPENSSKELVKNCLSLIEEGETLVNDWMNKITSHLERNQFEDSTRKTLEKEFKAYISSISTKLAKLENKLKLIIGEQRNLWRDRNNTKIISDRAFEKMSYLRWLNSGLSWIQRGIREIDSCFIFGNDLEKWKIEHEKWITKGVLWKEEGQSKYGSYMVNGTDQGECAELVLQEYNRAGFSVRFEQAQESDNVVIEVFKRLDLPSNFSQDDLRMALKELGWNLLEG